MRNVFRSVAQSRGIEIFAPETSYISFFNSPYYSHQNAFAVDIYPDTEEENLVAPSPVEGHIVKIYEFQSPRRRYFEPPETEKLILISTSQIPELWVRILHVDCRLDVGTQIAVGDPLGCLERSGFFNFWTGRHMHVEVRRTKEPLRAKGAFPMEPMNLKGEIHGDVWDTSILGIKNVKKDYFIAETSGMMKLGGYWGLGCTINDQPGILDCGLPHYGYGGAHMAKSTSIHKGDPVHLWGVNIGEVHHVSRNFVLFRSKPVSLYVNDIPFRGLSLYLWLKENNEMKLVPKSPITGPAIAQRYCELKLKPR